MIDLVALSHDAHKHWRDEQVGRVRVTVELANNHDLEAGNVGQRPDAQVRRLSLGAVVDTGAVRLVLPQTAVQRLGLPVTGQTRVKYSDGSRAVRDLVAGVWLGYTIPGAQQVRSRLFSAAVEPNRNDALIGAVVLDELDLVPDGNGKTLLPRDAYRLLSEIGW